MKESKPNNAPTLLTEGWLTLAEALESLGKSQSTLERLVGSRQIASRLEKRPGRKPERLYKAEDIARLRAGEGSHVTTREVSPSVKKLTAGEGASAVISSLDAVMTKWGEGQGSRVAIREKLTLTIAEASAYSGFGVAYLIGLIDTGKVRALKAGPNGSWVIVRRSLEEYVRKVFEGGG